MLFSLFGVSSTYGAMALVLFRFSVRVVWNPLGCNWGASCSSIAYWGSLRLEETSSSALGSRQGFSSIHSDLLETRSPHMFSWTGSLGSHWSNGVPLGPSGAIGPLGPACAPGHPLGPWRFIGLLGPSGAHVVSNTPMVSYWAHGVSSVK